MDCRHFIGRLSWSVRTYRQWLSLKAADNGKLSSWICWSSVRVRWWILNVSNVRDLRDGQSCIAENVTECRKWFSVYLLTSTVAMVVMSSRWHKVTERTAMSMSRSSGDLRLCEHICVPVLYSQRRTVPSFEKEVPPFK